MANRGSRQLLFRFPASALDLEQIQAYCQPLIIQDCFSLSTEGEFAILNVEFHPEDSYQWVEDEGWLPARLSLRDDILQGDYRMLYLAWLRAMEFECLLDSVQEVIGIRPGEMDADSRFSLDTGSCQGCCSLGPEIIIDGQHHGRISPEKAQKLLKDYA